MDANPRISVGMPVYNGGARLAASIESVLGQTFGDFELIISDNCSDDGSDEVCRRYADLDSRIVFHRNDSNIGAARNFNRLVDAARAPLFRWSNADDLLDPRLHEICFRAIESNPDAVLVYAKTTLIGSRGERLRDYEDNLNLTDECPAERLRTFLAEVGLVNALYGLIRTDSLRQTELMGDGSIPASDVDLLAELTLHGKFVEIPERLFLRRMHEDASSAHVDDDDFMAGFWADSSTPIRFVGWKKLLRYHRALGSTALEVREKRAVSLSLIHI